MATFKRLLGFLAPYRRGVIWSFVLAAKPTFAVLSRNPLKEPTQASVAPSDGEIFIRTFKHLWCIRERAAP